MQFTMSILQKKSITNTSVSPLGRSTLRQERHPNTLTAPPINRGSMPVQAWQGFWHSLKLAAQSIGTKKTAPQTLQQVQTWQKAAHQRRLVFLTALLACTVSATLLFAQLSPVGDSPWLYTLQIVFFAILSLWVTSGFITAAMGFYVFLRGDKHALSAKEVTHHTLANDVKTAVIMPICNEDVNSVFAGLRATCESIAQRGYQQNFDVFILSDSYDPAIIQQERAAWEALRITLAAQPGQSHVEVYYRLRKRRSHKKAGNVADFCRRWGHNYSYMVVLDADSVMQGDCLVTLVKLMEAHPQAGIIQTATKAIGHITLHARAQQFAARVTGQLFTLGMQFWQLGESHYWGHNAILRLAPFMQHCGLAPIQGKGGMSGSILSHDFVEAALMRRAGYEVWLVPDLTGSYEQTPPDLLSELQRDRRWCQGNLQNARLIAEPGIHGVHRAMFATGAMAYLSAPLWLAFITLGTALWLINSANGLHDNLLLERVELWGWTLGMLFLPRILGVVAILIKGQQRLYAGTFNLIKSAFLETTLALLQAPLRMLAHSLFVVAALTGLKLEWKSPPRQATGLLWGTTLRSLAPISIGMAGLAGMLALKDAEILIWLLPIGLPLLLAVPMSVLSSQIAIGSTLRHSNWLLIPEERWSPKVLRRAWQHAGLTTYSRRRTSLKLVSRSIYANG